MSELRFGMKLVAEVMDASRIDARGSTCREIPSALLGHRLGARVQPHTSTPPRPDRVDAVLHARRSVRSFSPRPVPASALGASLDAGMAADAELWPEEIASGVDLELVLISWSVDRLEPGVYVRDGKSFRLVGEQPDRAARGSVTLQLGLQVAPALIVASGNLLASCARHGNHGYRLLLLRAGAACHTSWLAGISEGLAGVVFSGFQPKAARHILGPSMAQRQLFALALGFPANDAPT